MASPAQICRKVNQNNSNKQTFLHLSICISQLISYGQKVQAHNLFVAAHVVNQVYQPDARQLLILWSFLAYFDNSKPAPGTVKIANFLTNQKLAIFFRSLPCVSPR
jgi:hypothetical protein